METVQITNGAALDRELFDLADAIRKKGGTTARLRFPGGSFQKAVEQLPEAGDRLFDANVDGTLGGEVETKARKIREYGIVSPNLRSLRAPLVTEIAPKGLYHCYRLTKLELPAVEVLRHDALYGGAVLPRLELPSIRELWGNPVPTFVNKLVLPGPVKCILHDSGMLDSVEAVYVPRALLEQYRSDTNWSYGSDFIYAIEDGGAG